MLSTTPPSWDVRESPAYSNCTIDMRTFHPPWFCAPDPLRREQELTFNAHFVFGIFIDRPRRIITLSEARRDQTPGAGNDVVSDGA